jgi:PAS domain S-box-containing protein
MSRSLRARIMAFSVGIAVAAVSVVAVIYERRAVDLAVQSATQELASDARLFAQRVEFAYGVVEHDAGYSAALPAAADLLRNPHDDGGAAGLEALFASLLADHADYLQIRLIALSDGRELVRVVQNSHGIQIVPRARLRPVADEPFFRDVPKGDLAGPRYSSTEVMGTGDGFWPAGVVTWRVMDPVRDAEGRVLGLAVVDVNYPNMLYRVLRTMPVGRDMLIFNGDGDIVERLASAATIRFSFHGDGGAGGFVDPGRIPSGDREMSIREDGSISYLVRKNFSAHRAGAFVGVALREPESRLMAGAVQARWELLTVTAGVLLIVLAVSALVARRFADYVVNVAARSRAVIDSAMDAIISIDEQGRILSENPAVERIFQYPPGTLIGRSIDTLMPRGQAGAHDRYLGHYRDTGIRKVIGYVREVEGRRQDGTTFPLELSVSEAVIDGQKIFTGNVRDISGRKAAEAEREHLIEALARSNRELDEFAFVASHDLKAPLRVIGNAASWLEEDLAEKLDEESRDNLSLLRGRVQRMDRLLDDLLEYSRIGRKTDEHWRHPLSGAELRDEIMVLIPSRAGFAVTFEPSFLAIRAPRMPLQQILINLIGNALKHHERDAGHVTVRAEMREAEYLISVIDDGPGIPPEYHDQIFKMFQTLRPRDRVEGSGMGLAIVRKHIDVLGKTLRVECAGERGSIFSFTYPRCGRSSGQSAPPGEVQ